MSAETCFCYLLLQNASIWESACGCLCLTHGHPPARPTAIPHAAMHVNMLHGQPRKVVIHHTHRVLDYRQSLVLQAQPVSCPNAPLRRYWVEIVSGNPGRSTYLPSGCFRQPPAMFASLMHVQYEYFHQLGCMTPSVLVGKDVPNCSHCALTVFQAH
jgi:hypothetical protein